MKRWGGRRVMSLRARWAPLVAAGSVVCGDPRCGLPIEPGQPWDLGHPTARALGGSDDGVTPWHASCNRADGGRLGHALRRHQPATVPTASRRKWL